MNTNWPEIREHLATRVCGLALESIGDSTLYELPIVGFIHTEDFRPDENPGHAWMVLESVRSKGFSLQIDDNGCSLFSPPEYDPSIDESGENLKQALCLAAARASGYQEKEKKKEQ